MAPRLFIKVVLVVAALIVGAILQSFFQPPTHAQIECQTFKETGKTLCGRFLQYWQQNGGLAQQGFPISNELQEVSDLNGQGYVVQYFERAVFEKHPENQPPYDVLLSQLGALQFNKKYPISEPIGGTRAQLPIGRVGQFFNARMLDGGTSIMIQQSLLSKRLAARLYGQDPDYGLLGDNFPGWKTIRHAPGTDLSGSKPAWVLMQDDQGYTVAVFTLVKEGGEWKIDAVEPNGFSK